MLEYPWGITGGVSIKREDFDRLKPGVYLNDNLIEFGLRYVFLKVFYPCSQLSVGFSKSNWDKINLQLTKTFISSVPFWFPKFER